MNGTVTLIDKGPVTIHSYRAPDDGLAVNTQLIETSERIVAIDGQYALAYAEEVVDYARTLGKPIDRIFISHAHPDHFQGAGRFRAPIHALPETIDAIAAQGDATDPSGTGIALSEFLPTVPVSPGFEVIDGVRFVYERVDGGEIDRSLLIKLPEQGVLIAQDLAYNHIHLWVADRDFDGWLANVNRYAAQPEYDTVLVGHGDPDGPGIWSEISDYLHAASELLGNDGDLYKKAIAERFPAYRVDLLIDIANSRMFGQR